MTSPIVPRAAFRYGAGNERVRVVALGDSLLTGYGIGRPEDVWLNRALERVATEMGITIELAVHARSGSRLKDVERDWRFALPESPDVIVLTVGSNDYLPVQPYHLHPFIENVHRRYRRRLRRVVSDLRATGADVIVTGVGRGWQSSRLHPRLTKPNLYFVALGMAPANWFVNRSIERATQRPAIEAVTFVDVRGGEPESLDERLSRHRDVWFAPDGFHPNEAGHELWAQQAVPAIRDVLEHRLGHAGVFGQDRSEGPNGADQYRSVVVPTGRHPLRPWRRPWRTRVRDTELVVDRPFGYEATRYRLVEPWRNGDPAPPRPVVVVIPDSPNVLEHHRPVFRALEDQFRVVGLEMPGAGHVRAPGFNYRLRSGGEWILAVLGELQVRDAILTASCVNGLWSIAAATLDRERNAHQRRIGGLVLCQTPSLAELQEWGRETIPSFLRLPLVGDAALRMFRSRFAHEWYEQSALAGHRPLLLRLAQEGFLDGAVWKLGALSRGIFRSSASEADPGQLDLPVAYLWGSSDRTHESAGTDVDALLRQWTKRNACVNRLDDADHFPDLSRTDRFVDAVRWVQDARTAPPNADRGGCG
jgi:lysophospholipase L1-like esterase